MRRRAVIIGMLASMIVVLLGPGWPARAGVAAIGAVPVATNLNDPAAFTFAEDGRIFYGDRRSGEIRIYDPANGSDTLFFTVPNVVAVSEQGLLGLALFPTFSDRPLVFAYATRHVSGVDRNEIVSIVDTGGTGADMKVIWSADVTAQTFHNGGRIRFGPDGKLYALTGDHGATANSQDLSNDVGKILRMRPSGAIPADNPFPGNPIWAYGIRNSFGFNFDPMTGLLWETENGPECNDELNNIRKGRNYGWGPNETCSSPPPPPQNTNQDGPNPVLPQVWFTPVIAPTGLAFCVGCGINSAEGAFFFGSFNDRRIRQGTLNADRTRILSTMIVYSHSSSILSMERGADHAVYFSDFTGIWKLIEN